MAKYVTSLSKTVTKQILLKPHHRSQSMTLYGWHTLMLYFKQSNLILTLRLPWCVERSKIKSTQQAWSMCFSANLIHFKNTDQILTLTCIVLCLYITDNVELTFPISEQHPWRQLYGYFCSVLNPFVKEQTVKYHRRITFQILLIFDVSCLV